MVGRFSFGRLSRHAFVCSPLPSNVSAVYLMRNYVTVSDDMYIVNMLLPLVFQSNVENDKRSNGTIWENKGGIHDNNLIVLLFIDVHVQYWSNYQPYFLTSHFSRGEVVHPWISDNNRHVGGTTGIDFVVAVITEQKPSFHDNWSYLALSVVLIIAQCVL